MYTENLRCFLVRIRLEHFDARGATVTQRWTKIRERVVLQAALACRSNYIPASAINELKCGSRHVDPKRIDVELGWPNP